MIFLAQTGIQQQQQHSGKPKVTVLFDENDRNQEGKDFTGFTITNENGISLSYNKTNNGKYLDSKNKLHTKEDTIRELNKFLEQTNVVVTCKNEKESEGKILAPKNYRKFIQNISQNNNFDPDMPWQNNSTDIELNQEARTLALKILNPDMEKNLPLKTDSPEKSRLI